MGFMGLGFMGFKWRNQIDSFHESFVWIYELNMEHFRNGNDIPPKNGTEAVTKKGFQCIKTQPNEEFNQEEPTKCRLQTVAQKNNRSFTNRRWRFNRFNNEMNSCKIKRTWSIDGIDAQIIWLGTGSLPFFERPMIYIARAVSVAMVDFFHCNSLGQVPSKDLVTGKLFFDLIPNVKKGNLARYNSFTLQ